MQNYDHSLPSNSIFKQLNETLNRKIKSGTPRGPISIKIYINIALRYAERKLCSKTMREKEREGRVFSLLPFASPKLIRRVLEVKKSKIMLIKSNTKSNHKKMAPNVGPSSKISIIIFPLVTQKKKKTILLLFPLKISKYDDVNYYSHVGRHFNISLNISNDFLLRLLKKS